MAVGDWSALTLSTDADVLKIERTWLDWTDDTAQWHATAKEVIERKLRYAFRQQALTSEADVLDLIANPNVLTAAAVRKAIELCSRSNVTADGDAWSAKARTYEKQFTEEFDIALGMIEFDADESGDIDDTERYKVTGGVVLTRGGALPRVANDDDELR